MSVKLTSFGAGAILGEIAFYSGEPRTASAVAETQLKAWKLTRDAVRRTEETRPDLAAAFHRSVARTLSERMQSADRLIRVLAD
jgi:SulP family sulfate permease